MKREKKINPLDDENKKLKDEIKKLKEKLRDLSNDFYSHYHTEGLGRMTTEPIVPKREY